MLMHRLLVFSFIAAFAALGACAGLTAQPPLTVLPSWHDGKARQALVRFVREVTDKSGKHFVPPAERIAVFDNDGTLWCEQPLYFQLLFARDRVRSLAPQHPEWKNQPALKAIVENDRQALGHLTEHDVFTLLAATHAGMTTDEFARAAQEWLATAKHPRFGRLYKECIYQPMLELLAYLRANGFKTYIVSGGGIDFLRGFTEEVYGIPPEQVIGSSLQTRFELRAGQPVLVRLAEVGSIDDKGGKPVNIHLHIGRRPILAFGNSDGDLQMLQFTDAGTRPRLLLLLRHDDAEREFAYGAQSKIGTFSEALLNEAKERAWTVISMKQDWKRIFPFEKQP